MTIEPLASQFVLIDADPLLEAALAAALGVDARTFLRLPPGLAAAMVLQPGAVGFECEVSRASLGGLDSQLRAMTEPLVGTHFVIVTEVAEVRARCDGQQVPVLGRARRHAAADRRGLRAARAAGADRAELLIVDAVDAIAFGGRVSEPGAVEEISVVRERASLVHEDSHVSAYRAG